MEDIDTQQVTDPDEHNMLLRHVIQGENDLLFLDSYLAESLRDKSHRGKFVLDPSVEEETI